jgi:LmbE family N-acetylglucosaminyl deacetylase
LQRRLHLEVRMRLEALRAHETQVRVEDGWFALSDGVARQVPDREAFQIAAGRVMDAGGRIGTRQVLTDLFSGVRTD